MDCAPTALLSAIPTEDDVRRLVESNAAGPDELLVLAQLFAGRTREICERVRMTAMAATGSNGEQITHF